MASARVPEALRQKVAEQARYRCGYCLRSEELAGMPMTIEHLVPIAEGGLSVEENLWLACNRCNGFKGALTSARDPDIGDTVPLFNPRLDVWVEHFEWNSDGTLIIGKTPRGRATVVALQLNNPEIVVARRLWVSAGWWPPQE
ncbi:MAG: HNH endonuclease [Chloroflexi bacterium]|nr:HNH endonuclease [Chloroflexota bacterium]